LLALALLALWARPLLPIDEMRYLAVAWDMWSHGQWLVPHLNGAAYADKPPLLFWLFHLGWALFGVNEWWPRLVPALFAVGSLGLTARLAMLLWPDDAPPAGVAPRRLAAMAVVVLATGLLWTLYTTLVMFDMVLAFFALLGLYAVVRCWRRGRTMDWTLLGLAIGLGVLAKGPVILLHVLPAALLAPWWSGGRLGRAWSRWYLALAGSVALGAAIALAWALPAAQAGGPAYAHAIFWGQTADRVVDSFAHRRPWWWYLPLLPVFLFPWLLWPPLWCALGRGLAQSRRGNAQADPGLRFCLAWLLPTLVAFSLVSGKQPHYLLPLVPGFALLSARLLGPVLAGEGARGRWYDGLPVAAVLAGLGVALWVVLERAMRIAAWPDWVGRVSALWGVAMIGVALAVAFSPRMSRRRQLWALAPLSGLLLVVFYAGLMHPVYDRYDLRPAAREIATLQRRGTAVALVGAYYGEYQFLGRLPRPMTVLHAEGAVAWARDHPRGFVLVYYADGLPADAPAPAFSQPYRTRTLAIWPAGTLARRAQLLDTQ